MSVVRRILFFATVLFGVETAHGNWFARFCERHLIMDDPCELERAPDDWLERRAKQLEIKATWGTLSAEDERILGVIRREVRHRAEIRRILERSDAG